MNSINGKILELTSGRINKAFANGWNEGLNDGITKLARHYMREHPDWSEEKATKMAKSILG